MPCITAGLSGLTSVLALTWDLSLHLFLSHRILDVVVMKTYRLRGQAWIVFADVAASTNARNAMQGFPFYDKPLVSLAVCGTRLT